MQDPAIDSRNHSQVDMLQAVQEIYQTEGNNFGQVEPRVVSLRL